MSWAAEEFATVNLGHKRLNKRLNKRLVKVVQQWADKPSQNIPFQRLRAVGVIRLRRVGCSTTSAATGERASKRTANARRNA